MALDFGVNHCSAIGVEVGGPDVGRPSLGRRIVELSDPSVPSTRQPYHDGFYKQEEDPQELARRIAIVRRCCCQSVAAFLTDAALAGARCRGAGLVVASVIDAARVGNLHIRAHASEGQLFRTVLADALDAHGIACNVIVDKNLAEKAVQELRRGSAEIARAVAALGKALGGPWRADEKAACTAAWLALS
jgi:hypothetical protein